MNTVYGKSIDISSINDRVGDRKSVPCEEAHKVLQELKRSYTEAREMMTQQWRDYYVSYLTTPMAKRAGVSRAARHIGDVNTNWRHKLKSPKAYEIIETLVSYFLLSFFPNDRYFDLVPVEPIPDPSFQAIIELNRIFVADRLKDSMFRSKYEIFIRELCITGNACLMFPWVDNNVDWQVLSAFEYLVDPKSQNPNKANFIRAYELSQVEFDDYIDRDLFNLVKKGEVTTHNYASRDLLLDSEIFDSVTSLLGINRDDHTRAPDSITVYEFWGDFHINGALLRNVRISWTDTHILNLDDNPYGLRPFILGTYLRLSESPYGIGALQPVASQLYYKDTLTSRQADNVAVSSDTMFEVEVGALIDPDDLFVAPGKKIFVTKTGAVNPIVMPSNTQVTMQDMQLLDQTADKAIGTGPYIGVNAGRTGERVTAQEVIAQRDTGGKRLSNVFSNLETESFLPLLERFHYYVRRFYNGQDIVQLQEMYITVTPATVNFPMKVRGLGAANVADREYNIRQLLDWLSVVTQNENLAAMANWEEIYKELTWQMVPQSAKSFIKTPEMMQQAQQQQQPQLPPSMEQGAMGDAMEAAQFLGGQGGQQAIQASMLAGVNPAEQLPQTLGV